MYLPLPADLLPWPSSHSPLPAPDWVSLSLHQLYDLSPAHIAWQLNVAHLELGLAAHLFVFCDAG